MAGGMTAVGSSPSGNAVKTKLNGYVILVAFTAALGGLAFGYEVGIMNQTLLFDSFRWYFGLSPDGSQPDPTTGALPNTPQAAELEGNIVSLFLAGCIPGAAIVSIMTDWIGRKWSIITGGAFFCVGGILQGAALSIAELYAGRFLSGFGVGILSTVVGMYIAECSPATFRGTLTSGFQLMITIGIMVANIVNAILSATIPQTNNAIWRTSLGIQGGLGLFLCIVMFFMPESPRHLMNKGKEEQARAVVDRLVGHDQVALDAEMTELSESVAAEKALGVSSWGELFAPGIWNRLLIVIMLQLWQQWTGINAIMYYSSQLFLAMGLSKTMATTGATTIQSVLNVLGTFPGMYLVERLGRKTLLFWGGLLQSLWMWGLVLFVHLFEGNPSNVAFSVISVILIYFYVLTFAASWGPVVWVYQSEVFPLRVRSKGCAIGSMSNWINNFIIAKVWPYATSLGANQYIIFGVTGLCMAAFVWFFVPETKGLALEEMDEIFGGKTKDVAGELHDRRRTGTLTAHPEDAEGKLGGEVVPGGESYLKV